MNQLILALRNRHTVDGWNLVNHLGCFWNPVNKRISTTNLNTSTGEFAGFQKHQLYQPLSQATKEDAAISHALQLWQCTLDFSKLEHPAMDGPTFRWLGGRTRVWKIQWVVSKGGGSWMVWIGSFMDFSFMDFCSWIIDVRCCFTSVQIGKFHILCSFSYLNLSNQERTFPKNEKRMEFAWPIKQVSCTYLANICSFAMESWHCGTLKEIVSLESPTVDGWNPAPVDR